MNHKKNFLVIILKYREPKVIREILEIMYTKGYTTPLNVTNLYNLFVWDHTPQGHLYWENLFNKYEK